MHRSHPRPDPIPALLDVRIEREPDRARVALTGEVDMCTAPQLAEALARLPEQGCRTVEVDLSGVGFLSAAGLAVLVEADRRHRARAARLVLVRPTALCTRLLGLTGLDEVLTVA